MCMNVVKGTGIATAGYAGKKYGIAAGAAVMEEWCLCCLCGKYGEVTLNVDGDDA